MALLASGGGETAVIGNPVTGAFGTGGDLSLNGVGESPVIIAQIIVLVWRLLLALGGLAALAWLLYGGITWLTAGGSKEKLENTRDRIINAIIGIAILFSIFAFVNYIGPIIGFDLLAIPLPIPE